MILTIIGARPQFVKAAVLSNAFKKFGIEEKIIHTGQHYDYKMNEIFFHELNLPGVGINLNIGSGSHGAQTAKMLSGIEEIILADKEKIDFVLVYGDTNSTLAGALAASKLHIPIIHVEAGLRSFNRRMPEEVNRVLTDHLSEILFCSSEVGKNHLKKEGIDKEIHIVGDIMLDAINIYGGLAKKKYKISDIIDHSICEHFNLMTIHRPSNTDDVNKLNAIIEGVALIEEPIVWPVHPRNKKVIGQLNLPSNIFIYEPFSYFEMITVLDASNKVITDSGGLQKEAYWKKKPCITVRDQTEWIETMHHNWNILCPADSQEILKAFTKSIDLTSWTSLYGDGNTAEKIINQITPFINQNN